MTFCVRLLLASGLAGAVAAFGCGEVETSPDAAGSVDAAGIVDAMSFFDAPGIADAAGLPDAAGPPDASGPPDAVPPPDAYVFPDAVPPPDAYVFPDAVPPPDAYVFPDAVPPPDATAPWDAGPLTYNYAFVSPVPHNAAFGGLAGADSLCNGWAGSAGLPGNYRAILSTSAVNAVSRLAGARGWIRPDGRAVGDLPADMFSDHGPLAPLRIAPDGTDVGFQFVWSGSAYNGIYKTIPGASDCGGWTSTNPADGAWQGFSTVTAEWIDRGTYRPCDAPLYVYCFQVDHYQPLDVASFAESGRRMFVSSGNLVIGAGIAAADALCTADAASDARLAGASFKAFIANYAGGTGTSAMSRFAPSSTPIVRLDGLRIANDFASLGTQDLIYPPAVRVSGALYTWRVFVGANSVTSPGTATTTCNGWTDTTSGIGVEGVAESTSRTAADRLWFGGDTGNCSTASNTIPVYCLEE